MKYGLMIYNYQGKKEDGYYCPPTRNVGDYIQSLAAKQFLPHIDVLVDRDTIKNYDGFPVKMIMNGWWWLFKDNEVLSKKITPLFVSYHIDNPQSVSPETIDFLKSQEPIGCRDEFTLNFLRSRGINAYFSACLTLTLGQNYRVPEEERTDNIYFVDFDYEFESTSLLRQIISRRARRLKNDQINQTLTRLISPNDRTKIIHRTHELPLEMKYDDCFKIAEQFLKDYARAKLVVTTRIHCALPCLGLGIPVLFVKNHYSPRFGGLVDMMSHIGINECREDAHQLYFRSQTTKRRSAVTLDASGKHWDYAEKLIKTCENFIKS